MRQKQIPEHWAQLITHYLNHLRAAGHSETTVDTRCQHLAYLARRIDTRPEQLTDQTLISWLSQQTWAPESRRGRTNTYRLFWRWATEAGHLTHNAGAAIPRVKAHPGIPRPTPENIYLKAIMRSDQRTRLILRLAAECGLRRAEIAQTHSNDLIDDLVGWSILVHGKGQKERIVPLTNGIALELQRLEPGYCFPGKINGHLSPRRIGELAAEALTDGWTLHTLRHRFATRAYSIDHDTFSVQELLGHASAETTRRYIARDRSRLRALVEQAAG